MANIQSIFDMPSESRETKVDDMESSPPSKKMKLGAVSGVYIPTLLNILSILLFLRFGSILGRVGLVGMLGLLVVAYFVDLVTTLSLSAIASNGEVKGGGAYYMISRSLGPEFGGSIGLLFYLSQVMNTALNMVGLIDCLKLNLGDVLPQGYWESYAMETGALIVCSALCLAGSAVFSRASNVFLVVIIISILSIPFFSMVSTPFVDAEGVEFTGLSYRTLRSNLYPHTESQHYDGFETFRELFGILFPATSGIFAGASMSGDLKNPSRAIPKGTLWAMLSTFILYLLVILSMASSITHESFFRSTNVVSKTSWAPLILLGECAVTFFSGLMGIVGAAKLLQALARDKLLPGLAVFGQGTKRGDDPTYAVLFTYILTQLAFFADLNQIATFISMGYQMTFFVMNLACFLLKIGSAPNFRPAFKFFSRHTAFVGSLLSAAAMFFIDETYAASAICLLVLLFLLIHYISPPKHWGDVSQNLIYHQVRKYLLRLKPEHIKFWRPQIILLINDPRHHTRLIQFCNSMKKGALYILGHVIVTDDFNTGIHEAKLQQSAWTKYISEYSRIKAFVQLTMSPSIEWGVRNLILSAGLGGMRPNIAVLGFYNMDELRKSQLLIQVPGVPFYPTKAKMPVQTERRDKNRRHCDTSARLLEGALPTDAIRTEGMMSPTSYMTILEDLALKHRLNVAIAKGFQGLETPRSDGSNTKQYVDLWPIQMSAEITAQGKSVLTTNFDTYTLILQLGYILLSVPNWKKAFCLRVLVFVEYESEVEEEKARLKALLQKLRIDTEIQVFWLASGGFSTYETIVNGRASNPENEQIIHELLKEDEWWQDLQRLRKESWNMPRSQEMASFGGMLEASRRRGSSNAQGGDDYESSRRLSMSEFVGRPRKATVSKVSKLGASFGIHTHQLGTNIFDENDQRRGHEYSDYESDSSSCSDADFNDVASVLSEGDLEDQSHEPLFFPTRRKSVDDLLGRRPSSPKKSNSQRSALLPRGSGPTTPGYGAITSTTSLPLDKRPLITPSDSFQRPESTQPVLSPLVESSHGKTVDSSSTSKPPVRPTFSRQTSASRFSSRPTPDTKITVEEGAGPSIMFQDAESSTAPKPQRPPMSRHSSMGRFSSRPVPDMKVETEDGGGQRLVFAEPETRTSTTPYVRSRKNSATHKDWPEGPQLNIPELLESYQFAPRPEAAEVGSNYSTQNLPLSFNDLPSRAQHLIINDVIRQNSNESAVLLTTLPIPSESTCKSEEGSLRYLSDIEVLCYDLPPVLLVLSNNMTVTVSL